MLRRVKIWRASSKRWPGDRIAVACRPLNGESVTKHRLDSTRRIAVNLGVASTVTTVLLSGCAPVMPNRTKPGGAARWAAALASRAALAWAADARPCRITGAGVGADGWLPDRGGTWSISYWSARHADVLEVRVDSDGNVTHDRVPDSPFRGRTLPDDWSDSPRVWAATHAHQTAEPLNTFDVELAVDLEPERFPGRAVWRIRFYLDQSRFETHFVNADATWLARE
jgi:hypothetical protein